MQVESESAERVGRLALRLGGERCEIEAVVPEGPSRLCDVLPAIRAITEAVVEASTRDAERAGQTISCRAGCGACCRQPVPVAASEAAALRERVAAMPDGRRRHVQERFAHAIERLQESESGDRLMRLTAITDLAERQALGIEYFRLGIACPFLEEESCSIHSDRPLACREYLVTSPAEYCAIPDPDRIEMVSIPVLPSLALRRMAANGEGEAERPQLLIQALGAPDLPPSAPADPTRPGPELLDDFLRTLAGAGR
jgi:Fe-S-cluster containining protein